MNQKGRALYEMCTGQTSRGAVCREYAARFAVPEAEPAGFIDSLLSKGILVQGGHFVTTRDFPAPEAGMRLMHTFSVAGAPERQGE